MINAAIGLYVAAGVIGVILLMHVLKETRRPRSLIWLHGISAGLALILHLAHVFSPGEHPTYLAALVIFILAIILGIYVVVKDLTTNHAPRTISLFHGALGLLGIIIMLWVAFLE